MTAIITHSDPGKKLAQKLLSLGFEAKLIDNKEKLEFGTLFAEYNSLLFIGSLGICVRSIAPFLQSKKSDPAVINVDVQGQYVQSVVSGHIGGGNLLCKQIASLLGAVPIINTVSDTTDLWSLDLLPKQFGWKMEPNKELTRLMASFVNKKPTALLLEARDKGTLFLENSTPSHVSTFYNANEFDPKEFELIIAVTPFIYDFGTNGLFFRPAMIDVGIGCQKEVSTELLENAFFDFFKQFQISPLSVNQLGTALIKKDEPALNSLAQKLGVALQCFDGETLDKYNVPNPSEKVKEMTGASSVSEASALHLSQNNLLIPKTKLELGDRFGTIAVALSVELERKGFVEIVGAGPGDPLLVTVRGKQLLQCADLILYAGSLVPIELTHYAKPGCTVSNSASMDLHDQVNLMKSFYDRGLLVVRLHTGDPCIYGAIQEQMNLMDQYQMRYRITPGVSSFQAAAAALKSQFTIPEEVQTIILTRGEGRTPVPEREHLHNLAKSQSTMCIFLSATIAEKVQNELLEHYPPETPTAVCYKLTWEDEKIYRCTLATLAQTIEDNKLTLTTLIVVGKAIDNRNGESKLYHKEFKHLFRK